MNRRFFTLRAGAILQVVAQIWLILVPTGIALRAQSAGKAPRGKGAAYSVYETSRTLLILPLEGDSKSRYAYLNKGVRRILASRLRAFGYIYVKDRRREFFFKTDKGSKGRRVKGANGGKVKGGKNEGGDKRVALRIKVLEADEENYKTLKLYDAPVLARRFNANYILSGAIIAEGNTPRLALRLYEARGNRTRSFAYQLNADRPYAGMTAAAREIFSTLSSAPPVTVTVETKKPGAMVYLDALYLGRTPVEYRIVPGRYRLRVEQEGHTGYSRMVRVEKSGARFQVEIRPLAARAGLAVKSEPSGARVYLNERYLGKTPLERKDLPPGTHRLRVVREKHVDRFLGIVLRNENTRRVAVSLSPGDTATVYKDPGHVILNWTYEDLSLYSWISSLVFYGGFGFFLIRADRTAASIRAEVPLFLGINEFGNITGAGVESFFSSLTAYQLYRSERNLDDVRKFRRRADISGGLAILGLLAGGLFLYLDLTSQEREAGEVGYFLEPTTILYGETREGATGIKAGLRISF